MPGRRNRIVLNPLMHKGGVHQRSSSAGRRIENELLETAMDEWLDDELELDSGSNKKHDSKLDECD